MFSLSDFLTVLTSFFKSENRSEITEDNHTAERAEIPAV